MPSAKAAFRVDLHEKEFRIPTSAVNAKSHEHAATGLEEEPQPAPLAEKSESSCTNVDVSMAIGRDALFWIQ